MYGIWIPPDPMPGRKAIQLIVVNCAKVDSEREMQEIMTDIPWWGGEVVVWLDEVHLLHRRHRGDCLLSLVEERDYLWICSTAKAHELDPMLVNRFVILRTQIPSLGAMREWIVNRCREWGIQWEPEAALRLAEKSNCVPGTALQAITLASLDPTIGLTRTLVEEEWVATLED
jgi:hypothetical protein